MYLSLEIISMKWYSYVYWARRHFILACVSAKKRRASASEREWWCRSADEHQWTCVYIVCERQRTQHSATERRATATKRVASVLMPQLNCHLISLDRTCCRRWAQLSVSWRTTAVIPWKWKQNRQTLWRSSAVLKLAVSRRFSNKNRQCVIVALLHIKKDFNCLSHFSAKEWYKIQISAYLPSKNSASAW